MIWHKKYAVDDIKKAFAHAHMGQAVGIEITEIGPDFLKATMPVDDRTKQPFGLLHGGASCVLSESLGSTASWMCIDPDKYAAVGIEINASHLRNVKKGHVTGICKPVRIGKTTHVWQTDIYDENQKLVCSSRLTVAIVPRGSAPA